MVDNITLPRRNQGSGSRLGGINIPDAGNVPQQGLRPDPGLNFPQLPQGAFGGGTGLEAAGKAIQKFAVAKAAAVQRQQKEYDAARTNEALLSYERQAMDAFQKSQTEDDPSRVGYAADLQKGILGATDPNTGAVQYDGIAKNVLDNLDPNVSEDARQRLGIAIQRSALQIDRAAGNLSIKAGQDKAYSTATQLVNSASAQASYYPDNADAVLTELNSRLDEFNGTMGPEKETAIRNMATKSVAEGQILGYARAKNYGAANATLVSGKYDTVLTADDRQALTRQIHAYQSQDQADADRQRKLAREAASDAQDQAVGDYVKRTYLPDQNGGTPTIPEIAADPRLKGPMKEHLIEVLKKDATGQLTAQFDANTYNEAFAKVAANPYLDFGSEITPLLGKGLDAPHFTSLRETAKAMQAADAATLKPIIDEARSQIDQGTIFGKDPIGADKLRQFNVWLTQQIINAHKNNIPIRDLTDSKSPYFVGNEIQKFKPSALDALNAKIEQMKALKAASDKMQADVTAQKKVVESGGAAPPAPAASIQLNLGPPGTPKTLSIKGETYEVLGPAAGPDGKPAMDGSLRVKDPVTGRTGVYKP